MTVDRHHSPRTTGAISLHACVDSHVLTAIPAILPRLDCWNHILCVGHVGRLARVGLLDHMACFGHIAHLVRICFARCSCSIWGFRCQHGPCEDHFQKVVAEWPSDGPVMVSQSHEHVWYHSGSCWPTSMSEVP